MQLPILDQHERPLRSLRLSVTDRCNLRCGYCMPEERYAWLPKPAILRYEESIALVAALVPYGLRKLRITGGEPLLRRDITDLVAGLDALRASSPDTPGLDEIALTTNAVHLAELAAPLRSAGLDRLTVSLDTLEPARFLAMTSRDELDRALRGLEAAAEAGFQGTKLNTVVVRGQNDDELADLLRFGAAHGIEVRFIEYMDVGGATRWSMDSVVPADEILQRIEAELGEPRPDSAPRGAAPAARYRLPSGQRFGLIASTTRPFCSSCDRARLTADGTFFTCLYATEGTAAAPTLRGEGAPAAARLIADTWRQRSDRGAEVRAASSDRAALAGADELRARPHLEMHTRGG
ncbi:MAG: GTP 3',8-cyclase MoaA [Planctomycetota bacterium]|nr:GTP 3',8-cyclase MoaA [Planctomycetota bacterium]